MNILFRDKQAISQWPRIGSTALLKRLEVGPTSGPTWRFFSLNHWFMLKSHVEQTNAAVVERLGMNDGNKLMARLYPRERRRHH